MSERRCEMSWRGTASGSIAGGSHEVQNGIIAKRILGLPDVIQKAH